MGGATGREGQGVWCFGGVGYSLAGSGVLTPAPINPHLHHLAPELGLQRGWGCLPTPLQNVHAGDVA